MMIPAGLQKQHGYRAFQRPGYQAFPDQDLSGTSEGKIVTAASDEAFEKEYQNMPDTLDQHEITAIDEEYNKVYQEYREKKGNKIEDINAGLYKYP